MDFLYERLKEWMITQGPLLLGATLAVLILSLLLRLAAQYFRTSYLKAQKEDDEAKDMALKKRVNTLFNIFLQAGRVLIWVGYILFVLPLLGVNIGPILAGAGILGLAIGFGSQELVRDIVSGIFNLIENNFRVGDVVTINGVTGTVEKIELRTTQLRDNAGNQHIFQNGKINQLANLTKDWSAAVFKIEVPTHLQLEQVMESMREAGENLQQSSLGSQILEPVEVQGLDEFSGSKMIVKARIKTRAGSQWVVGRAYRQQLKSELEEDSLQVELEAEGGSEDSNPPS